MLRDVKKKEKIKLGLVIVGLKSGEKKGVNESEVERVKNGSDG